MTNKHVDMNPVRTITKANLNHKPDHIDGGESGTPAESSESSISGTPTGG